ncbi:MAG TPA: MGMT family protein [Lacipirellulaceae bacterium]|jgi:methylated-DNA-[protein]-cysteine S-methyltransferase
MSIATTEELDIYSLDKTAETIGTVFSSDLGWMAVAVRGQALCGLVFGHPTAEKASAALGRALGTQRSQGRKRLADDETDDVQFVRRMVDDLQRFAAGEPVDFREIAVDGDHLTPFGRRIVAACRRIPFGKTRSYGELAAICGSPGAARAVGQVMAKNRYPLVVPCHRVLGSGGQLGGFSAPQGLTMKRRLLSLESAAD